MTNPQGKISGKIIHQYGDGEPWEQAFTITLDDNCCESHGEASAKYMVGLYVEDMVNDEAKYNTSGNEYTAKIQYES